MRYVTLKGGPFDGRREGVLDACHFVWKTQRDSADPEKRHTYYECPTDPTIFEYSEEP